MVTISANLFVFSKIIVYFYSKYSLFLRIRIKRISVWPKSTCLLDCFKSTFFFQKSFFFVSFVCAGNVMEIIFPPSQPDDLNVNNFKSICKFVLEAFVHDTTCSRVPLLTKHLCVKKGGGHNWPWNFFFVKQAFGVTVCGESLEVEIKTL